MGECRVREASISESDQSAPNEHGTGYPALSDAEGALLARQISAVDGVTYTQAQQQVREMMGFGLGDHSPAPMTMYNQWKTPLETSNHAMKPLPATKTSAEPPTSDNAEEIAQDLGAVRRIDAIPTLLDVLCDCTGMRFAAVARVTEDRWTACAVRDDINFGIKAGGEVDVKSTLCLESRALRAPIVIEAASMDPVYSQRRAPRLYGFESYISVPIVLPNGRYFGNLCAIDPTPAKVAPRIVSIFTRFAQLIGQQIESELARVQEQTALHDERAAGELREQFIAILGHDLRNPLHAIFATADTLERRLDESTLAGMATRIKANAHRMSALIDDVLDFARARLGSGIGIDMRDADDIEERLTAVVRELQDANPGRNISVDIDVPGHVFCDIGRVQQIASNLVANALTHGFMQSPIRVTASADRDYLSFSVWNDGEPIPAHSIGKVFEPFWRHSISNNRQGLGLGLYICSQIVRAHKGVLSVTSTQKGGTTFNVRLPIKRARLASIGTGPSRLPIVPARKAERSPRT